MFDFSFSFISRCKILLVCVGTVYMRVCGFSRYRTEPKRWDTDVKLTTNSTTASSSQGIAKHHAQIRVLYYKSHLPPDAKNEGKRWRRKSPYFVIFYSVFSIF